MFIQGLQGPRLEPIILISWSLWVSINSAWRDESFELGNRSVAPLFPEKNVSSPNPMKGNDRIKLIRLNKCGFSLRLITSHYVLLPPSSLTATFGDRCAR